MSALALQLEVIPCPVCGAAGATPLWSKDDAHYVCCPHCTLVYENPRLTAEALKELYSRPSYFVQEDADQSPVGYQNYFAQCTPQLNEEYFRIVQRAVPGGHELLDVGCGLGGVLLAAQHDGWDAVGVELSSWAVKEGRKHGARILEGSLVEAGLQASRFDAVSMFDVLEHLPSPVPTLREAHRLLKPGGALIMETPNIGGFFARSVYRENSDLVKPRAHICLYSTRSARMLLAKLPFARVRIETFPYCRRLSPGYFLSVLRSRVRRESSPVQLTWNDSLRIVAWK